MPYLEKTGSFLSFLFHTYYEDRCLRSAAALCYTTLLSLVPLTAVIFSIFAAFPMFETIASDIQGFVFENFVPASGEVVQQYLEEFTAKASKLTAIGTVFLILSALLMMNTIEGAMNDIWHIKATRKAVPKFMMYWAVLTLGPLLMGASLAITSYLTSLPLFNETAFISDIKTRLLGLLPFFATTLACTLLYAVVPNTRVPLRPALVGAVVAALLFELAKKGFAFYVTAFPTYEMVYGALAAIPVFLVWVYLSWMVILLGAEISYCLTHMNNKNRTDLPAGLKLLHDFRLIGYIWQAQRQGHTLDTGNIIKSDKLLNEASLDMALARLEESGLVHQSTDNGWALTRDMSTLTLKDLYQTHERTPPTIEPAWLQSDAWYQAFGDAVTVSNELIKPALAMRLQPVYEKLLPPNGGTTANATPLMAAQQNKGRIEPTFRV